MVWTKNNETTPDNFEYNFDTNEKDADEKRKYPNGNYVLVVTAVDSAGNTGSRRINFTIDQSTDLPKYVFVPPASLPL